MSNAVELQSRADADAIAELIAEFAAMTEPDSGPGVTRLAYTPLERAAHERFTEHMRVLGLRVWTDAAGNTIAERAGTDPSLPAIGTGSHLDSVPQAGRYDGIAGVVAAIEVARLLQDQAIEHRHPVRFVAFAAEEGARFGQACTGSRIAGGLTASADLDNKRDVNGVSIAEAMRSVGIDPAEVEDARWRPQDWHAFVELHIEQGSVLDTLGLPIGVVDQISGSTRFALRFQGRASHTGGTPMHLRADALAAAAQVIFTAEALAKDSRHHGTRITVGRLEVSPGSITTIPGDCHAYVDVRDVDSDRQRDTAAELADIARGIGRVRGVKVSVRPLADASPIVLPASVRNAIVHACITRGLDYRVMPSGASHDTQMISGVVPSGMVFVPSRNHGVSHSPDELTDETDLAAGVDVLIAALLALDGAAHESPENLENPDV
ncbi:Zn-dependent hydrolase [Streptomyces antimycoticus]|uniref:Zn-dependent hydrolase n=1 Tax=Streptomyces antimycoticus TaxID=68175 RepID=UPI000A3A8D84|nr:Zn-dependent hydrolase [Streptomyces antimycoticus]